MKKISCGATNKRGRYWVCKVEPDGALAGGMVRSCRRPVSEQTRGSSSQRCESGLHQPHANVAAMMRSYFAGVRLALCQRGRMGLFLENRLWLTFPKRAIMGF